MNENRRNKQAEVAEILKRIEGSKALVVAGYTGLTVKQLQELRSQLREKNVELKVYKNRLFKIAADKTEFGDINSEVTGQNIFAFGLDDDISPAKVLSEFAKKNEQLVLKAGTYEGKVVDVAELNEIATLPTYEEALMRLARALMTPINDLGIGLNMLTEDGHLENGPEETKAEVKTEAKAEETATSNTEEKKEGN